jgi:pimeloyl-ACP methyl ester carboxylesterase
VHLGLERMRLLGHSAGASLVTLFAAQYPELVEELILVTPSPRAVGIEMTTERRRRILDKRTGEPWYPEVAAAFEAIQTGEGRDWDALKPAFYGRWDDEARKQQALEDELANLEGLMAFNADEAFDPPATRAALAHVHAPALVISGDVDWASDPEAGEEIAGLFPNSRHVVLKGAAHHPWMDERDAFRAAVTTG